MGKRNGKMVNTPFKIDISKKLIKVLKKLKKKSPKDYKKLWNKMKQIAQNPKAYKPLKGTLKEIYRVHLGHFVLLFTIFDREKVVEFIEYDHHDKIYKN